MKKLGIDMDGVICDYQSYFIDDFNNRFGSKYTLKDWKDYYFVKPGFGLEEFLNTIKGHSQTGVWRNLNPINKSIETINRLSENNSIHIITHKIGKAKEDTIYWLNSRNVTYDTISFTDKKARAGYVLELDVMIEDSIQNAVHMAGTGIMTLLYNRPWNQEKIDNHLIQRVHSWSQIEKILS